jgi:cardiolipin synthase (CMP-forming)
VVKLLPNILTAVRLALAPLIFSYLWSGNYSAALVLFGVAALTDGLDGYLARALHAESAAGALLDPIADKILLGGTYLTLALSGGVPAWIAWIVLGRDAVILASAGAALAFAATKRTFRSQKSPPRKFPPSVWGKISTAVQMAFILAVLLDVRAAAQVLMWAVAALTVWSGIDYARRAFASSRAIQMGLRRP